MASIQPEQMQQAIGEILQTFSHTVNTAVDKAAVESGKQGAAWLKRSSPRRSGKYARSWTYLKTKRGTVYIHNKERYRLTHLLEKGHILKNQHGGPYGRSQAIPHISTVENAIAQTFEDRVIRSIETQK